jgi:hypothetical protein
MLLVHKNNESRSNTARVLLPRPNLIIGGLASLAILGASSLAFADPVATSGQDWIVGAFLAPPSGPGWGRLEALNAASDTARNVQFAKPHTPQGNSFYVAYDAQEHAVYVPTVAGRTDILDSRTFAAKGHFASVKGGRVAAISPDHKVLLIISGKETAAYSIPNYTRLYESPVGGNAVAFKPDSSRAFVGGNSSDKLTEIDVSTGKVERSFPVAHTGDMIWADGKLFSADMQNGVMSVLDPATGSITQIKTPEVDPHFSYKRIPAASAGFMQIAADPAQHKVYAAGFSGHILEFSTADHASYVGEIAVRANPHADVDKLSGLSIIGDGKDAAVTVENLKTTVVVRLSDGHIEKRFAGVASNRWVKLG